jgi:hypothetical protein
VHRRLRAWGTGDVCVQAIGNRSGVFLHDVEWKVSATKGKERRKLCWSVCGGVYETMQVFDKSK